MLALKWLNESLHICSCTPIQTKETVLTLSIAEKGSKRMTLASVDRR